MQKNWIKLDFTKYNDLWEETSTLFWCGGDTYAIVWTRPACNLRDCKIIAFYNSNQIYQVWQAEVELQLF